MTPLKRYDFVCMVRANDPVNRSDVMILECPDGPFIRVEDLFPMVSAFFNNKDLHDFKPEEQAALNGLFGLFGLSLEEPS